MCTLTYWPAQDGFAMMSSRDEAPLRGQMVAPQYDNALAAAYPVDSRSGGTWFLTAHAGRTVNILNGGFEKHIRKESYRHSRGWVPLHFQVYETVAAFVQDYDFQDLEPFTLVVASHLENKVEDVVWDGAQVFHRVYNPTEPMIWSSATLYNQEARALRRQWFQEFYEQKSTSVYTTDQKMKALKEFHETGGAQHENAAWRLMMQHEKGICTVAHTGVEYSNDSWRLYYHDLVAEVENQYTFLG